MLGTTLKNIFKELFFFFLMTCGYVLHCVPAPHPKIHILKNQPSIPQDEIVFKDKVFKDVS